MPESRDREGAVVAAVAGGVPELASLELDGSPGGSNNPSNRVRAPLAQARGISVPDDLFHHPPTSGTLVACGATDDGLCRSGAWLDRCRGRDE